MRRILQRTFVCISVVLLLSSMGALSNVQVAYAGTNEVTFQSSAMAGINQTRANFVAAVANQAHDYYWNTLGFTEGKEIENELDDIVHVNYRDLGFPTSLSYGETSPDGFQDVNVTVDDTLANYTTYELALNATVAHEIFHVIQAGYGANLWPPSLHIGWVESTAQALEAIAVQSIWGQVDPTYLDPINSLAYLNRPGGNYMGNPDRNLLDLSDGRYAGVLFWIYEQQTKGNLTGIFSDIQSGTDSFTALQNGVGGADALKELFRDYVISLVTESRRAGLTKTSTIYPLSASSQIDEPTYVTTVNAPQNRGSFSSTVNLWGADFIKVNYKKISVPVSVRFDNKGNNDVLAVAIWRTGTTYHSFQLQNDARTLFNVKNADEFVVAITQVGSSRTGAADDYEIRITQSLDMIFTIDVTGSMWDDIDAVKAAATNIANTISTKTEGVARFAIVAYRDFPYYPYGEPDDIMFEDYAFTNVSTVIVNNINALTPEGGADWPEAVFEALLRAINASTVGDWITDASKYIILAGDAPHHEVCPVGLTINDVITAAEAADPVIIHSIVVGYDYDAISQFSTIANGTEGIFLNPTSPEEFAEAVNIVVHEILLIPDLAVSLDAPALIEPGTSSWLNATVRNTRLNRNETNVELQLLINGSIVDSVIIPELQANSSYTLSYLWTPIVRGTFNVTAYAPPLPEEDSVTNNVATVSVLVRYRPYTRSYLPNEWIGGGSPMGWHGDDDSWSYSLPFNFPFYGTNYTTIYISSNGLIAFLSADSSYSNSISALAGKLAIAPAWDDWVTYDPYDIYIWQNSTHVGIRWNVSDYASGFVANFEAILSADGIIQFNYGSNDGPISATVGISNGLDDILAEDLTNLNYINTIVFTPQLIHDIAVTNVTPSKTVVGQGYSLNINVTAANQGDYTETFNVTTYTDLFFDPFDLWNYTGAWRYYDPDAAEGYVSVSDGMLHVSGWYAPGYQEGGLTTIKEFNYPITVETKIRANSADHSPALCFAPYSHTQPGSIWITYDIADGGWHACYVDTTGYHDIVWGGSISAGTWYTLKLVVNETNFKAYVDDALKVDRDWSPPQEYPKTISLSSTYGSSGDFDWVKIGTEIETKTLTLTSGASTTIIFTWNTTGFAKGNYTISAYAKPVLGEIDTANNNCTDGLVTVTWLGDLDADFDVDQFDYWHFCGAFIDYYTIPVKDPLCDFDDDCDIDQFDYWTFCGAFIDYWNVH